jgi:hypothetical protein
MRKEATVRLLGLFIVMVSALVTSELTAQQASELAGTWTLVSASASTADGRVNRYPFGASPKGMLIYTNEGRMTAVISYGGRKPLSGADRIASPADERADAFATFFAYAGRYSFDGGRVVHHVEMSSVENWVDTDLIRLVQIEGETMTLKTPPLSVGGRTQTSELVWRRMESSAKTMEPTR